MGRKNKIKIVEISEEKFRNEVTVLTMKYNVDVLQEIHNEIIKSYFQDGLTAKKTLEKIRDIIYNKIDESTLLIKRMTGLEDEEKTQKEDFTKAN
jgi:hypothetical protein